MKIQDEFTAHLCHACQKMLNICFIPGDGYVKTLGDLQVMFKHSVHDRLPDVIACTGYTPKKEI